MPIFKSAWDGTPMHATFYAADEPRFLCQIVHGMAEHSERYLPLAEHLVERGGAVALQDLRGHGKTAGEKDYGYFGESGADATIADVLQVGDMLREMYPGLPFILLGHSMGSLIVRAIAAEHDDSLDGLLVLGEASYNPFVGVGRAVASIFAFFAGDRACSHTVSRLATGAFNRRFPPVEGAGGKFLWLSADLENRIRFENDPACGFDFTLNGHITLFTFMQRAYAPRLWNVRNRDLPVLFLSGEDDPVMTDRRHFDDAVQFMRDMGYRDVSSHLYPGMRHEILNETDHAKVYHDIDRFIDQKVLHTAPIV